MHTKHIHSKSNSELIEETKHSYNHAGRLSETVQIVNEKDSTKMSYLYDDLGNIKSLTRIDGTSTLTTTNTYNIRNWLTSIESLSSLKRYIILMVPALPSMAEISVA